MKIIDAGTWLAGEGAVKSNLQIMGSLASDDLGENFYGQGGEKNAENKLILP